jgi:predicted permease
MSIWRTALLGIKTIFNRSETDKETAAEVQHYFDMTVAEFIKDGMNPDEARHAALLAIGPLTNVREEVRSTGWEHAVETFADDIRYALRRLRSNKAFTAVAVVSLALGIGANTAIFSAVNAVLIRPMPMRDPESLALISGGPGASSYPEYLEIRDNNSVFQDVAALAPITGLLSDADETHLVRGAIVTGNLFKVLGVNAATGRAFSSQDDVAPGAHPVAVVSDRFWKSKFSESLPTEGRKVRYNGQAFTIIGVMPPDFHGPIAGEALDIYVPMMMQSLARPPRAGYSGEMNADLLGNRQNHWLGIIGRLKTGVTTAQARASLEALMQEQERLSPSAGARLGVSSVDLLSDIDNAQRQQIISVSRLLMAVVGAVLLIACVNVANLTLAQGTTRRKEVALRLAIGASRSRVVRQLLTESLLIAWLGGVCGIALAWGATTAFSVWPPPDGVLPLPLDFSIDASVLGITAALALVTGIVFGLAPAISASRQQLVPALKDQTQNNNRWLRFNPRNALVVVQLALSLVLLITGGLFLRSFSAARDINLGFDADRVGVTSLSVDILKYTRTQGRTFYQQLIDRVQQDPSVASASLSRWIPLTGAGSVRRWSIQGMGEPTAAYRAEGDNTAKSPPNTINVNTIGTRWFETMGIPLLRGRDFAASDDSSTTPVAIVNDAFVQKNLRTTNPIGQRISFRGAAGPWHEIVGVVGNIKVNSIKQDVEPLAYIPLRQNHETGVSLYVRAKGGNAATVLPVMRREIQALDINLPISNIRPLSETASATLYASRIGSRLLMGFGVVALLLATVGLYGVISYAVSRRTREFGVRMALGAQPVSMMQRVVRDAAMLATVGIVIGVGAALSVTRLLQSFLYGISAHDALTFIALPLLLLATGIAASIGPAWRAMRVDPVRVLKSE